MSTGAADPTRQAAIGGAGFRAFAPAPRPSPEGTMDSTHATVVVGRHSFTIERLERLRWRVTVDGRRFATFCSESRARAAGRFEARRLDHAPPGEPEPGRGSGTG